jgi:prolyl 4-hydroxylase
MKNAKLPGGHETNSTPPIVVIVVVVWFGAAQARSPLTEKYPHTPHQEKCILLETMADDPIVKGVEGKMSFWSGQPKDHGELLCIHRIEAGQEIDPALDTSEQDPHTSSWGYRTASILVFLNSPAARAITGGVTDGGELHFPDAAEGHLEITPKQGDALLLWNLTPDRTLDTAAKYGVRKPSSGTMWLLTRWFRQKSVS